MNPDPAATADRAYDFLYRLVTDVGPRPAGSPAEDQAREMLAGDLGRWGYILQRQSFHFAPQPDYFPFYLVPAVIFPLAVWLVPSFPWLALLLPLLPPLLPQLADLLAGLLRPSHESCNLLALPEGAELANLDLLLVAHVDTARAIPSRGELWYQWRIQIFPVMQRLAWILAGLALLNVFGLNIPRDFFLVGGVMASMLSIALLVQDLWEQPGSRGHFSPGANDNASGAGVLMALAEQISAHPPQRLRVGFAFSSAEECGLTGAKALARAMAQSGARTRVVSVDMVASGDRLNVVTRAGRFFPRRSDPDLVAWLHRADPQAGELVYTLRSGDFVPFIQAGLPAAGLEGSGSPRFWRAYHTLRDGLAVVEPAALQRTVSTLTQLIWLLDKEARFIGNMREEGHTTADPKEPEANLDSAAGARL
ncbi:MAG TPA: M28 family peptidase [Anaerolineaceae bacterium]|nr:M28 family peptidase [Anaerolineaceae bacterium]